MKKIISFIILSFIVISSILVVQFAQAAVHVNGYYKKDGTYVAPYYRSNPDGDPYNNWSYPGNTNPYTGKTATGDASTYLNNYYNNGYSSDSTSYASGSDYATTPTCPLMASYNYTSSSCECMSGYVSSGNSCISDNQYCWNSFGYESSYDSITSSCACDSGYALSGEQCVSKDQLCHNQIGSESSYDSLADTCKCYSGYVLNNNVCSGGDEVCVQKYGANSSYNSLDNTCECDFNYAFNQNNQCVSLDTSNYASPPITITPSDTSATPILATPTSVNTVDTTTQSFLTMPDVIPAKVNYCDFENTLKKGSTGQDVIWLQDLLERKNFLKLSPNMKKGNFGPATMSALKKYQKSVGVKQTGILDEATRVKTNLETY